MKDLQPRSPVYASRSAPSASCAASTWRSRRVASPPSSGSSGSGKTTLLRIVAGFERPDEGEVRSGREVVDDAGARFVPIGAPAHRLRPPGGRALPAPERRSQHRLRARRRPGPAQARVSELLELVGLTGLGRRYPHQLSGGQQQRVALARALAIEPEIVLLDEPFSSLDAALRASVRADVHDVLREAGTTSILVTHDQDEALSMADQVAVLRARGRSPSSTPRPALRPPARRGAGEFLGESNVLEGEVRDGVGHHGARPR